MDLVFSTFNVHLNQIDLDLLYANFFHFTFGTVTVINSWDHDEDYKPMVKLDKIALPFSNRIDSFRRRRFMACLPYNAAAVCRVSVTKGRESKSFRARYRPTSNNVTNSCVEKMCKKHPLSELSVRMFVPRVAYTLHDVAHNTTA